MRYLIGFLVALALVVSPLRVSAQEIRRVTPWCGVDLFLSSLELGRLDDFYPGALPKQSDFDDARLDAFYPEEASKEPVKPGGGLSRGARIGIGVGVSVVVIGAALGAAAATLTRGSE